MPYRIRRLLPALCAALLVTGAFTQAVVTAPPASAATVSGFLIQSNDTSSVYGQSVTFSAVIGGASGVPTGAVDFQNGATTLCAGRPLEPLGSTTAIAECAVASLTVGAHSITASYSGDSSYDPATSTSYQPALVQEVSQAQSTTGVETSLSSTVFSGLLGITATVSAVAPSSGTPTGAVEFLAGGETIGGCEARPLTSGAVVCTTASLAVGAHTITAEYAGDGNFAASTGPGQSHNVVKADTTTTVAGAPNPSTWAQDVVYTASVSPVSPATAIPAGGTVAFAAGGGAIAGCGARPVTSGTATCETASLPVGDSTITATYSGTSSFVTSSSITTQTVGRAPTDVGLTSNVPTSRYGQRVTFTAAVTSNAGTPGGTVSFFAVQRDATRKLLATKSLAAGLAAITVADLPVRNDSPIVARYNGATTYAPSEDGIEQTVHRSFSRTLLNSSVNPSRYGQIVTLIARVNPMVPGGGQPSGKVAFYRVSNGTRKWIGTARLAGGVATLRTSQTPIGVSSMIAEYAGGANHRPSSRTNQHRVRP